jgi:hypothetical protein
MVAGATQTFVATVSNDSASAGVTWSATVGSITAGGVYTAPAPVAVASATITATSKTDATQKAIVTVTLTPITVSITTTPVAMVAGAIQTFATTVTGDTTLNAGVTWTASVGTITAAGVYTAPTPVVTAAATITAASKTDTTKTATATVPLTPISVAITTTPVAMVAGATQTFATTVTGDATLNAGVTWSASVGTITAAGVYTAPTPVSVATATITAASKTDNSKTATATVTLTPIAVTIPTTPTAIAGAATEAITATVANDITPNAGVTWSITSGGGALSAVTTTSVTYTAPLPVTTATAVITATSKTDPTKTATFTIPLTPISVGAISPATVNLGTTTTQAFTGATVAADSSNSGVTWSISPATGAGTIVSTTGAYTAPATVISSITTVTVTATSVKDPTKFNTATITLNPIAVAAVTPATVSLNGGGTQTFGGAAVTYDGTNSGVTWSISPATGAGTIVSTTGVYTAPAVISGTSPVTVTVTATSVKDNTKKSTATITLNPISLSITPTSPAAMIGGAPQAFTATVANDGSSSGVTWSVTSGGGSFSPSSTLSGIATTYTSVSPVVTATAVITATSVKDPTKTVSATITLIPITITLTSASAITVDGNSANQDLISATIANDGSASGATFTVSGPGGGTMSANPVSGNSPSSAYTGSTVASASTATVTVASVKDPTKSVTVAVTLSVPMSFTTPQGALTAGTTNTAYPGATIVVAGGTGTKTFTITTGSLPAGLTMSSAGVISGSVTGGAGTSTFSIHVTDQATNPALIAGTFTITVTAAPLVFTNPSAPITLPTATVGTAVPSQTLTTTGGTGGVTYSLNSGALPTGLSLTPATGVVSGTPTQPTPTTGNVVTFKVTDSASPTPATAISPAVTIIVNPVPLVVNTPTLPTGFVGTTYNGSGYQFTSTGGTGTVTWTMSPTTVDTLTLSTTGQLSGIPTGPFSGTISVTATDSATNQQQTKTITPSLTVSNALTITTQPSSLPVAYTGTGYNTTLAAAGGTSPYTWSVASGLTGSNSLQTLNLVVTPSTGAITGTPTASGTANFTVKVTDSATPTANTTTQSYSIQAYVPLSLPTPSSTVPGPATTTAPYIGSITATGGVPNYAWTVNGCISCSSISLGNGSLSASPNGATLNITGTPASAGMVSFTASVKDSTGTTTSTITYTIAVSTNYSVSGNINLNNFCGSSSPTLPAFTLTLSNSGGTVGTATSNNGSFSITNIANGTYTLTPSISGPASVFYPATQSVTVNSGNITNENFNVNLGYTVSGTATYSGAQTVSQAKPIYLSLNNTNCGGNGNLGTSISAAGPYTIHGVPPGTYTLTAFQDSLGFGAANTLDPSGTDSSSVTVSTSNFTGANVPLADPAATTLGTSAPKLQGGGGFANGAMINYKAIQNSNGVEMATSYTLQWSTTAAFTSVAGSKTFPANGTHNDIWLLNSASSPTLTNGGTFYFRAYGTSAGTSQSTYSNVAGPFTLSAPAGGNAVTGTVTSTGTVTGPLYVGFFDQSAGIFYGEYFASPVNIQGYTIQIPTGSNYYFAGILDQNNNGIVDAGDQQNVSSNNNTTVAISGTTPNENLTLPSASSTATVTTQNQQSTSSNGNSQSYSLNFQVNGLVKQPVAVTLTSSTNTDGANSVAPTDIALCTGGNGGCSQGFQFNVNLSGTSPKVNDTYTFNVAYASGSPDTLTATVTAVLTAFPTNLSPAVTSSSLTPSFSWTDPTNASNYTYQFYLNPTTGGNTIWQIPGNNSKSNGFSSTITSIPTWGTDPTGGGSTPSSSLTSGTSYNWQIQLQDSNGNQATQQTYFVAQ